MRIAVWLLAGVLLRAAPTVTKVDPPNWWVNHSINPVRVLIRGAGLKGATATGADSGIEVSRVHINSAGAYLFADVHILRPGKHPIKITTAEGSVLAPFEALPPIARAGRFQGFSEDDLIYLIMPDRFANGDPSNDDPEISKGLFDRSKPRYYHGGDLQGVIDRLPYLKDLGVTALWINPVYDNVNHLNEREKYDGQAITDYHGYGAVDFYGVEEHFGTLDKFREFVDAAHRQGLKVILDMVANHTGPYHPWVNDPPTPAWFHDHLEESWQTWTLMDPKAPESLRRSTLNGWFANILPDLNQSDPEVARYIIQNTLWWVGAGGLDGIRQDTLPYVPRSFWRDWMGAIKRETPRLKVVGEMFDGDPALVSFFQGGRARDGIDTGVDSLFDFPLYYAIRHVFAGGQPARELATSLAHDYLYPNPDALVTFLGLHDVVRFMSETGATPAGLKLAFTFLLTARGIPMIYYGDEIAMQGGADPDNRRDFPGGWKEDPRNAFTAAGRTPAENDLFDHVRKLARLRAQHSDLRRGELRELAVTDRALVYARGQAVIAINAGPDPETVDCAVKTAAGVWSDALGGLDDLTARDNSLRIVLPPRSSAIFFRK